MCMNGSENVTRRAVQLADTPLSYLPEALLDEAFALSIYKLVPSSFFSLIAVI